MPRLLHHLSLALVALSASAAPPPNIILIVADDLGYADLGCQGAVDFDTPHLDRLAASGTRLTNYCSAASTCSPSRAALLTGRYPDRIGLTEDLLPSPTVDADQSDPGSTGLPSAEITVAEILHQAGYATACIGNWHLGDRADFLPTKQGFDRYFGIPYSNDLGWWHGRPNGENSHLPPIPLLEGVRIVETSPDQRYLTQRYTKKALTFLAGHRSKPFFLYLAHAMPHVPIFPSPKWSGSARYGLYGDVVQELDASVGEILDGLKTLGLEDNTLVIFTSDNGPQLTKAPHAGRATPFREGARTRFEGGYRVPCLIRWPGHVPAGKVAEGLMASIDWMPTLAGLASAALPDDHTIDGLDCWSYLSGKSAESPRDRFFYSPWVVRMGSLKLFLPGNYREVSPRSSKADAHGMVNHGESRLFDLSVDPGETHNLAPTQPEKVTELTALLKAFQEELKPAPDAAPDPGKPASSSNR